jgi:hypothetical protein
MDSRFFLKKLNLTIKKIPKSCEIKFLHVSQNYLPHPKKKSINS